MKDLDITIKIKDLGSDIDYNIIFKNIRKNSIIYVSCVTFRKLNKFIIFLYKTYFEEVKKKNGKIVWLNDTDMSNEQIEDIFFERFNIIIKDIVKE